MDTSANKMTNKPIRKNFNQFITAVYFEPRPTQLVVAGRGGGRDLAHLSKKLNVSKTITFYAKCYWIALREYDKIRWYFNICHNSHNRTTVPTVTDSRLQLPAMKKYKLNSRTLTGSVYRWSHRWRTVLNTGFSTTQFRIFFRRRVFRNRDT